MKKWMLIFGILAALSGGSLLWSAEAAQVRVQVDGLSCPFCAYGMEKKLKKLDGLTDVKILVDKGEAHLTFRQDRLVDFDAIQEAIRKGGFTPSAIRATLTGTLSEIEGRLLLLLDDASQSLLLSPGPGLDSLKAAVREGDQITITGEVSQEHPAGHGEHPHTITVEQFKTAGV